MKRVTVYSNLCSIVNLAIVLTLIWITNYGFLRLVHVETWWIHIIIGILGFIAYGFFVQHIVSGFVNEFLHRLFFNESIGESKRSETNTNDSDPSP